MLRAQGVAARARCGFGAYFEKGKFVDHWVTEYWNEAQKRWVLVDPQLDARQRELFKVTFDPLDVPRDQFLVAGDAWQLCRGGKADPARPSASSTCTGCGSSPATSSATWPPSTTTKCCRGTCGAPWPAAMPSSTCAFFDRLAELSHAPDEHADELRAVYEDKRIAVPGTVFNAVLNRPDHVH